MIRKFLIVQLVVIMFTAISCGNTPKHSEPMQQIIEMNMKLWEDLNTTKAKVKTQLDNALNVGGNISEEQKVEVSEQLVVLVTQKDELKNLDKLIPEIEGYAPKCNHEDGEAHSHNTIDIKGVDEKDLMAIHKELRAKLDHIMARVK